MESLEEIDRKGVVIFQVKKYQVLLGLTQMKMEKEITMKIS